MAKVRATKTAKSTSPNAGLEKQYREKLQKLISEMSTSVNYWISAEYRKQESEIVGDASPGKALSNKLISVMATWREKMWSL